ncbi:hypothetical protein QJS66_02425 [Kocuria rhizophila]|nr:hypothetical protein QJS66_02425 [Kocuria rhizophila]
MTTRGDFAVTRSRTQLVAGDADLAARPRHRAKTAACRGTFTAPATQPHHDRYCKEGGTTMALWTDVLDPATPQPATPVKSLAEYEAKKGTLAQWLPNRTVTDTVVRLMQGDAGLVDVAKFAPTTRSPRSAAADMGVE